MYRSYKVELERLEINNHKTDNKYTSRSQMAGAKMNFVVFLPSVRDGRNALRVRKFIESQLKDKYTLSVLDPAELDMSMIKMPMHHYQDRSKIPKVLLDIEAKMKAADGFIVVTAEYNHSVPPALTNLLDHIAPSLFNCKPSAIVAYSMGPYAGMRAAMQLRCLLAELGTMSVPMIFGIPVVHTSLDENGKSSNSHLEPGLATLVKQLDWYATALKSHRDKAGAFPRNPGE